MAAKVKTKGVNLPVPQDDSEARNAIREIGDLNRDVLRIEAEMNDRIAEIQAEFGAKVAPLREQVAAKTEGLRIFAEANRDRLTNGGKVKYARFATGSFSWRLRPAKVSIRGKDNVIAAIKSARLAKRFLRIREDLNKEAMLEDRATAAAIPGVSIGSDGEDFIVEPSETELAEAS